MSARLWAAALATGLCVTVTPSLAAFLVDTGPVVQGGYGGANVYASDPPTTPYPSNQFIGGQFNLAERSELSSVEGWMASDQDGTLSAVIYSDAGNLPASELFASQFTVNRLTWQFGVAAGWFGATGLSWVLGPGTYWLAFEVRPSDSLYGVLPNAGGVTMQASAPSPLVTYALNREYSWDARSDPWSMRIAGEAAPLPVPEPATLALAALGLTALGLSRRRSKQPTS